MMDLQTAAPWIEVFWCMAHRLELSPKDALNNTPLKDIDEMLMGVYKKNHLKSAESWRM